MQHVDACACIWSYLYLYAIILLHIFLSCMILSLFGWVEGQGILCGDISKNVTIYIHSVRFIIVVPSMLQKLDVAELKC